MIPVEVSVALIGVVSVIGSSAISYLIAKKTSEIELKKQREIWGHEHKLAFDSNLSKMVSSVYRYLENQHGSVYKEALEAIATVRVNATGDLAELVDKLQTVFSENRVLYDREVKEIKSLLEEVVKENRKRGGKDSSA